jgi:4-amino-4-deoxy-L-arabinose transferase-like glycosyltransferase
MESRRTPVSPSSRPAQASRLETLLYWALLGIVALRGLFFLVYSARTLLFHFPVDYDEGIILHSALRLAGGEAVYPPLEAHHFVSSVYTPLFYLLTAPFLRLIGPSLVPGRLVALLATLGSCALLAALVRAMGAGRRAAAPPPWWH